MNDSAIWSGVYLAISKALASAHSSQPETRDGDVMEVLAMHALHIGIQIARQVPEAAERMTALHNAYIGEQDAAHKDASDACDAAIIAAISEFVGITDDADAETLKRLFGRVEEVLTASTGESSDDHPDVDLHLFADDDVAYVHAHTREGEVFLAVQIAVNDEWSGKLDSVCREHGSVSIKPEFCGALIKLAAEHGLTSAMSLDGDKAMPEWLKAMSADLGHSISVDLPGGHTIDITSVDVEVDERRMFAKVVPDGMNIELHIIIDESDARVHAVTKDASAWLLDVAPQASVDADGLCSATIQPDDFADLIRYAVACKVNLALGREQDTRVPLWAEDAIGELCDGGILPCQTCGSVHKVTQRHRQPGV